MYWKDIIRKIRINWIQLRTNYCPELKFTTSRILIMAPHPDDETMGMGGVIQRLIQLGFPPHIIVLSKGENSHQECCDTPKEAIKDYRSRLTTSIMNSFHLPNGFLHFLDFPDSEIDKKSSEIDSLKAIVDKISPQLVFFPHKKEGWPDHFNTAKIAKSILPAHTEFYEYCVWMWYYNVWRLDWKNARVLRMSPKEHKKKIQAIDDYSRPKAPCGKPWSGVLPQLLIDACSYDKELFFKVNQNEDV